MNYREKKLVDKVAIFQLYFSLIPGKTSTSKSVIQHVRILDNQNIFITISDWWVKNLEEFKLNKFLTGTILEYSGLGVVYEEVFTIFETSKVIYRNVSTIWDALGKTGGTLKILVAIVAVFMNH